MARPTAEQIAADYQQYLGRAPEEGAYQNYWAGRDDYDPSMIFNSPEGLDYYNRTTQNGTVVPGQSAPAPSGGGGAAMGTAEYANEYIRSHGATPNPTSGDYWASKWNEWGKNDPNYYMQRLAAADEIIGGPQNSPFRESAPSGGGGGSSSFSSSSNPYYAPAAPQAAPRDPRLDALYAQLLARSQQGLNVDANDPSVKPIVDAARLQGERALTRAQQANAERRGPYATGALEAEQRMGSENLATGLAQTTAGAIGNEIAARRNEIAQALSGQFGVLSLEESSRLREQDQALAARQQDIGLQQQNWEQAFQEKGFSASEAHRLWQEMFNTRQQNIDQSNQVWNQNWKVSGG